MNDRKRFVEVLTGVYDFYGKDMSDFAIQVWANACAQFDTEQVTKALSAHLMDPERGQFMPKPADIVRQLQGTHTDRSLMAWGRVLEAMQLVGGYRSVDFADPAIHAAIEDLGGWPAICATTTNDLPFTQKRFCDLYRAYIARPGHAYPQTLQGRSEAQNKLSGAKTEPAAKIGARAMNKILTH